MRTIDVRALVYVQIVLQACGLAACRAEGAPIAWTLDLGDFAERATAVRVAVLDGGCGGEVRAARWIGRAERPVGTLAELPPGEYALHALAIDRACVRFADVCRPIVVPATEATPIILVLEAATEIAQCADCREGRCEEPDAGLGLDAGLFDAGLFDGGTVRDAGHDAGPIDASRDAGPPEVDAGSPCGGAGQACCASTPACGGGLVCAGTTCETAPSCPSGASCDTCKATNGCGHCLDDGSCRAGDASGPASGACDAWVFGLLECSCTSVRGTACTSFRQCCGPNASCRAIFLPSGPNVCCSEGGGPCAGDDDCCGEDMQCVDGHCRCQAEGETCTFDQDCCSESCDGYSCLP